MLALMSDQQRKINWNDVKTFHDETTGFAVVVEKSDAFHPRYNLKLGRMHDGRLRWGLRPIVDTQNGTVKLSPLPMDVMQRLVAQAEWYVQEETQKHEDEFQARRREREEKQINRGKQETRHTGKTQRERDKRRNGAPN